MTTEEILQKIQEEISKKENISHYNPLFDKDGCSLPHQLCRFIDTGQLWSKEIIDVIFNALANIFEVTIVLLTTNLSNDCYFLAKENDYIIPRMKISHETICMMFDGDLFHALLQKDKVGMDN